MCVRFFAVFRSLCHAKNLATYDNIAVPLVMDTYNTFLKALSTLVILFYDQEHSIIFSNGDVKQPSFIVLSSQECVSLFL